ncbi:hypothetical protein V8C26DRAFT_405028 [Trichoderma gracile]
MPFCYATLDVVFFVSLFASRPLETWHSSRSPSHSFTRLGRPHQSSTSPLHEQNPRTARKRRRYERNKQSTGVGISARIRDKCKLEKKA